MIRRGFWLAVGAVSGIMGYRRVVSAGRTVSGRLALLPRGDDPSGAGLRRFPGDTPGPPEPLGRGPRARRVKRGLIRGTVKFGRDAHSFTRDVREGMELYIARHPGPERPTLPATADTDVKDGR